MNITIEELRGWIPTIQPALVAYFMGLIMMTRLVNRNERQRAWALSALTTPIVSVFGAIELLGWVTSTSGARGIVHTTPMSDFMIEYLKAYFAIDLIYCGIWHPRELGFLDGWLHHIVYIVVLDRMGRYYAGGFVRPFLIMEVPAAIRAWKMLAPQTATSAAIMDNWFAATFAGFRIVWPTYVITQIYAPTWIFMFIIATIVIQSVWFVSWTREKCRRHT